MYAIPVVGCSATNVASSSLENNTYTVPLAASFGFGIVDHRSGPTAGALATPAAAPTRV